MDEALKAKLDQLQEHVSSIERLPDFIAATDNRTAKHLSKIYVLLTESMIRYNASSERSNKTLLWLTAVIVALTAVLVFLTAVLLFK